MDLKVEGHSPNLKMEDEYFSVGSSTSGSNLPHIYHMSRCECMLESEKIYSRWDPSASLEFRGHSPNVGIYLDKVPRELPKVNVLVSIEL